jgi:hypothetical protein
MKYAMIGALLITFPALAAWIYGLVTGNYAIVIAASASLFLNSLPFVAAGLMLRKSDAGDLSH